MNKLFKAAEAAAWGAVSFGGLSPFLSPEAHAAVEKLCPRPQAVLVAAFPYFAGAEGGNIALYARGEDYHLVLLRRLRAICEELEERYAGYRFVAGADNSPLPEKLLGEMAALGQRGRHDLLMVAPYGSYVFLGTILTDYPLEPKLWAGEKLCTDCGLCEKACPSGALDGGFCKEKCLSHISQKKGELSLEEASYMEKSPLVWGCDSCQRVCPVNKKALETEILEFRENRLCYLDGEEVAQMSNRQFKEKYGDRAFSWRGPAPIRRNFQMQKSKKE